MIGWLTLAVGCVLLVVGAVATIGAIVLDMPDSITGCVLCAFAGWIFIREARER